MKKWLIEKFLPLWAKETVLADNRHLAAENFRLQEKLKQTQAYIAGMQLVLRRTGRTGKGE